jgi:RimJ/RimL family protein N-acetyltransferase
MHFETEIVLTKKQKAVTLRMPHKDEASKLLNDVVEIVKTSPFVLLNAEDFKKKTIEEETKWIEKYIEDQRGLVIFAEYENNIIGILDFQSFKNAKMRHRGALGISLHHTMRGEGLGELLFKKLLKETKKIEGLTQIELSVMSDNLQAFHLYKKVGFIEIGRRPMAYKQPEGNFCDEVMMVLAV